VRDTGPVKASLATNHPTSHKPCGGSATHIYYYPPASETGPAAHGVGRCIAAIALAAALFAGCQNPSPNQSVNLAPAERLNLQTRSIMLLLRAAESDLDDVSCNAIEALVRVAPQDGLPAFRKAVNSSSPLVRHAALVALGEMRERQSLAAMVAAARDSHPYVRLAGAFAACRCGKTGYARLLVRTLTDNADEGLRAEAAALLGRLEEPRAVPWLRAALGHPANKRSTRVTIALYGALARLGEKDALQQLIYYSQGGAEARADALLLLADLGHPEARDALRYRLLGASEEYDEARLLAARGLGRLGYRDGFDLAMQRLAYKDPNTNPTPDNPDRTYPVRSMAVHALAEMRDERALPALRDLAAQSADARLQVAACYAICRILQR